MSIVLVASLGARSGDVARSKLYTGTEFIKWKHIHLHLEGSPRWENHAARVTIEFTKGHKNVPKDGHEVFLKPLSAKHVEVCPLALIIVHALRHGLVAGSSVQDVLDLAYARADQVVQWTFPERPVLPSFGSPSDRHQMICLLDKPATGDQILGSIKFMGLMASVLAPVTVMGLRRGHARDSAHVQQKSGQGHVNNHTRQSLGHNMGSFNRGTTQMYIGDPTQLMFNDIVDNEWIDKYGPKLGSKSAKEYVNAPVTSLEIEEWLAVNNN